MVTYKHELLNDDNVGLKLRCTLRAYLLLSWVDNVLCEAKDLKKIELYYKGQFFL